MSVGEMLAATVPMARTLHLEFLETGPEKAVVALPDQGEFHNHVGGPHAGQRDDAVRTDLARFTQDEIHQDCGDCMKR